MSDPQVMNPIITQLNAQIISQENFQAYGQVISATDDSKSYDLDDAQLVLHPGTPRFYIMRLSQKGTTFKHITRHLNCTQCLGSLEGKEWLMGVAPPSKASQPAVEDIIAFRIPGNCFIKLEQGTWHAGPYFSFDTDFIDFYNLELSDTNINDHETCNLSKIYNREFEIV